MASVLVVDDDADGRQAIEAYLTKMGHSVRAVSNGRAALAALGDGKSDVVVLDLMMPEMDGVEFLNVMHGYLRWQKLPVVIVTAYPDAPQLRAAREMGIKSIFTKGQFHLGELWQCVNALAADPDAAGPVQ